MLKINDSVDFRWSGRCFLHKMLLFTKTTFCIQKTTCFIDVPFCGPSPLGQVHSCFVVGDFVVGQFAVGHIIFIYAYILKALGSQESPISRRPLVPIWGSDEG